MKTRPNSSGILRLLWLVLLVCAVTAAFAAPAPQAKTEEPKAEQSKVEKSSWAVQVGPVQAEEGKLPADFSAAIYENLISELTKSGRFTQVYRSGDKRAEAASNVLVLTTTLKAFTKGNQTKRAATTVSGATKILVNVKLAGKDGKALVDKDVNGNVRFFGENLRATLNLARSVSQALNQASLPAGGKAGQ